jgi:2-polyprenyl-6-methoxyphenol hydroxylase-like FAD-dependent oxidoreductase
MTAMRIAVLGGGPGGLYFAALAKQLDARHDITVWERNAPDDTFGFGVVFSDETLGGIEHADEEIFSAMRREFARWDDIDVHFRGTTFTSGGHGFAAMSRKRLLAILQARCAELGVRILFRTEAPDVAALAASHDLVVAADGMNSATRSRGDVRAGPGAAAEPVHLARHGPGLRRVQVLHPGYSGRDHAGARLPVQRAGQHLHSGDARGRLAARRVRRHRP